MSIRGRIREKLGGTDEKRAYVRSLFSGIAPRYDLTNDVMSFGLHRMWKRQTVELAELPPEGRVLDLAAGTGDLAATAAAETDGIVVALDLTREMLQAGVDRHGRGEISWVQGDGLNLPFPDRSFDRVLVGYGLRNLADLEEGLREILRCLRPGGMLVSLDFARPRSRLLRAAYLRYLEASTAAAGWLLHRDPEAYLYIPESLRRFPEQEGLLEMMEEAGFARYGYVDLLFGTMAIHFAERPERAGAPGEVSRRTPS